jgi:hypothetical protein
VEWEPQIFDWIDEAVLAGVLFDVEVGSRYVITDKTVNGGQVVKQSMA